MEKLKLIKKDYQTEYLEFYLKEYSINQYFKIQYHTYLKYWSCHYFIHYGEDCRFELKSFRADNKKHAKQILSDWINNRSIEDIKLNPDWKFYVEQINNDKLTKLLW